MIKFSDGKDPKSGIGIFFGFGNNTNGRLGVAGLEELQSVTPAGVRSGVKSLLTPVN